MKTAISLSPAGASAARLSQIKHMFAVALIWAGGLASALLWLKINVDAASAIPALTDPTLLAASGW